jgi:hypothetical protein
MLTFIIIPDLFLAASYDPNEGSQSPVRESEFEADGAPSTDQAVLTISFTASAPDQDVVEAVAGFIGGSVTLTIPNAGSATSATWTLDGDTQAGETGITLELTDLVAGDSGAYVASFNDGSADNTYTANLTVTAAPTGLPVAGLFGLVTLVVGLAAGGTAAMRRRK